MSQEAVLVVENDFLLRKDLIKWFSARGFAVLEANDGVFGWATFVATSIDVTVTNVHLPGEIDGVELATRIRSIDPGAKIVAMSGSTSEIPAGLMDAVLEKPLNFGQLHKCLVGLLPNTRAG